MRLPTPAGSEARRHSTRRRPLGPVLASAILGSAVLIPIGAGIAPAAPGDAIIGPLAALAVQTNADPTTPISGAFTDMPDGGVYRTGTTAFSVPTGLDLSSVTPTVSSTYAAAVRITLTGPGGIPVPNKVVTLTGNGAAPAATWILNAAAAVPTLDATTNADGQVLFRVLSTATGPVRWTATAGSLSATLRMHYDNTSTDARTTSIRPSQIQLQAGRSVPVIGSVADRYGNPVSGIPVALSIPTADPVTFTGETGSVSGVTDDAGQFSTFIRSDIPNTTSTATVTATLTGSQLTDAGNTVAAVAVPGVAPGVPTVSAAVTVAAGPATVTLLSPSNRAAISSNGYFNVFFATTNVPIGATAYLALNGLAKAKAAVTANSTPLLIGRIPAEQGNYTIRINGGGTDGEALARSSPVSLTIIPFGLNGAAIKDDRITFRVKTGNFSPRTFITLTRNGIGVSGVRIPAVGAPLTIIASERPGTYQVRVNSIQGFVYGDHAGLVTIE